MNIQTSEREAIFSRVEEAYRLFYQGLYEQGEFPYRSTRSGMWAVSCGREAYGAFCRLKIDQYEHVADLGSGDGKIVLLASLFTRATGYEVDEELYFKALELRDLLGLFRACFVRQDFMETDLDPYDLLYIYPDKPLDALEEKLLQSRWCGRLLVNGPHFPPRRLRKIAEVLPGAGRFFLYECPWSKEQGGEGKRF